MRAEVASSTAKVIAASTILLDSDPRTARLVAPGAAALCRKFLSGSTNDRRLAWSAAYPLTRAIWRWVEKLTHPGIMAHYWYRKQWIESRCRAAIGEGFERIVVIGAGFDTLGCRLAETPGQIEVIEIDHPATQRAKKEALESCATFPREGIRFVALDLGTESLPMSVVDGRKATFIVMEGVLMYLSPADIDRVFDSLRKISAERVRFIFSFMTRWPDGGTGFRPRSWLIERWLKLRGEPFMWAIEPQGVRDFIAARGFGLIEMALTREISNGSTALEGENLVLCERTLLRR